ncbi:MAG: DAK2 domain-containing protein, partial [Peptococcus niger]
LSDVLSGEITTAVRDTVIEDIQIMKDEYLAILDGKIIAAKREINGALDALVEQMAAKDVELITFYRGLDVSSEQMEAYLDTATERYSDIDFEAYEGGQAIYPFIISAE